MQPGRIGETMMMSGPVGHREEDYTNTVQILGPDKPPPLAAEPELVSETVSRQCRSEMVQ